MNRRNLLGCLLAAPMVPFVIVSSDKSSVSIAATFKHDVRQYLVGSEAKTATVWQWRRNPALVAGEWMDKNKLPVDWERIARDAIYLEQPVDP